MLSEVYISVLLGAMLLEFNHDGSNVFELIEKFKCLLLKGYHNHMVPKMCPVSFWENSFDLETLLTMTM